ncbi:hypothetical protein ACFWFK_00530 [Micromonospora chalcea]
MGGYPPLIPASRLLTAPTVPLLDCRRDECGQRTDKHTDESGQLQQEQAHAAELSPELDVSRDTHRRDYLACRAAAEKGNDRPMTFLDHLLRQREVQGTEEGEAEGGAD